VVVIPSEDHVDFSQGRNHDNPDDPDGDDHEQAAWWHPDHARKNPALRSELKSSGPWDQIKKAAAVDPMQSWKDNWRPFPPETDDVTLEHVLGTYTTLNDQPEAALPTTDGIVDDSTGFAIHDPEAAADASSILAGNSVDGAHLPSSDIENQHTTAAIVEEFQRSAGAKALADTPELSAKLQSKTAMAEFSFDEQQALINEGKGDRARNFDDLKIAGTHYELLPDDADDDHILWI
jgi:hypothetical protein